MTETHSTEEKGPVKNLLNSALDYGKTSLELIKVSAVERGSKIVSKFIVGIMLVLLFFFSIVFLNVALALWIGSLFSSITLGFLIVGGFYLLLFILLMLLAKKTIGPIIRNAIIKELYD